MQQKKIIVVNDETNETIKKNKRKFNIFDENFMNDFMNYNF